MWKTLTSTQVVNRGDTIRYLHSYEQKVESIFTVVKTDAHYFEILPVIDDDETLQSHSSKKIVRYFDVGYNINIEVWIEHI